MSLNYILALKAQYASATGYLLNSSKEQEKDFIDWVKRQNDTKEKYKNYLLNCGINYNLRNSAEFGKGFCDTISSDFGESLLVTNYGDTFKKGNYSERIIPGNLYVGKDVPCAVVECRQTRSFEHIFLDSVDLFYTQNIFWKKELLSFAKVHNLGKSIVIGAYGKLNDKDRNAKIKQLREFKELLLDRKYKENYIYSNDDYIYFIHSDFNRDNKRKANKNSYILTKER